MKRLFVTLMAVCAIAVCANAANYKIEDSSIDELIENATEVSPLSLISEATATMTSPASVPALSSSPSSAGAFILCFFLGGFGVHRHYLGTRPGMWAIYTFTFGGIFGIVPLVDWVMLLIGLVDDDISQYVGNTKFFMWA